MAANPKKRSMSSLTSLEDNRKISRNSLSTTASIFDVPHDILVQGFSGFLLFQDIFRFSLTCNTFRLLGNDILHYVNHLQIKSAVPSHYVNMCLKKCPNLSFLKVSRE